MTRRILSLLTGIFLFSGLPLSGQIDYLKTTQLDSLLISTTDTAGQMDTIDLMNILRGNDRETSFTDQTGRVYNHAALADKIVLFDFWFLRCAPCVVELPGLELLNKKVASDDFVLLTFANDSMAQLNSTLFRNRSMDIAIIDNVHLVSPRSYPLKVLLDREGKLLDIKTGGSIGEDSVQRLMDKYYPLIREEL